MLYGETMKEICGKLGIDRKELPDGLYSTLLGEIKARVSSVTDKAVSGDILRMDDVSPVEQSVSVKVKSKNLFDGTLINGVIENAEKITDDGTGFYKTIKVYLKAGNYMLSFGENVTIVRTVIDGNYTNIYIDNIKEYPFVATCDGYVSFSFRNAVSGVIWDNTISIQLEEGDTATEYTRYVDVSTVKVTRCGKNLLSYPYHETTRGKYGIMYTDNGDGSITINGTATAAASFVLTYIDNLGSTVQPANSNTALNATVTNGVCTFSGGAMYNANIKAVVLNIPVGTTVDNLTIYPQAEYGTTATEYEAPKSATYTPNADGTVDGVASVSPTMTIFADKDGVTLDVKYTRDFETVKSAVK